MAHNAARARRASGAVLSYSLRLYPTSLKSAMLTMLCAHFAREHARALPRLIARFWENGRRSQRGLSQRGEGEFAQRALRRASLDLERTWEACRTTGHTVVLPTLRAELCDAAETQAPRRARRWQVWIHIEGLARDCQLYVPANFHRAINRTLALPDARMAKGAEVFRKNGKWYARIAIHVPAQETYAPRGFLGVDVGVRKSLCTSDGYRGPDLRPILRRSHDRQADQQRRGITRRCALSFQRSRLAHEARRVVSVARASGRGVAVEDPKRLIRWKGHAARYFGQRVLLLGQVMGVPIVPVNPAYTSQTHARCGSRESTVRNGELLWCAACRALEDADVNAAKQISLTAHAASGRGEKRARRRYSICGGSS